MPINAGDLDRRVKLLRVTAANDGFSSDASAEAEPVGTRWMSKREVSDGEQLRAGALGASVTARFLARWDSITAGMRTSDRLSLGAVTYEIVGIKEVGHREGIEFTTRALQ